MPNGLFSVIQEKDKFVSFVKAAENSTPKELEHFFSMKNHISEERVALAYDGYVYEIKRYAEYLNSHNPDHYKRSGALLESLCKGQIITGIDCEYSSEDIEGGLTRFNYFDSEHIVKFLSFHEEYYNEFAAFDISYRACCAYEANVKPLTFDMIHSICHYLKNNGLPSDAYFMLFKALMY